MDEFPPTPEEAKEKVIAFLIVLFCALFWIGLLILLF